MGPAQKPHQVEHHAGYCQHECSCAPADRDNQSSVPNGSSVPNVTDSAHCAHAGMTTLDKTGVFLSGLCAVHCVLTPVLLSMWPILGEVWGGSTTHWIIAGVVVPLAAVAFSMGYRHHRRVWVPAIAGVGVMLILVAMLAPGIAHHHHIDGADTSAAHHHDTPAAHEAETAERSTDAVAATFSAWWLSESAVTIAGSVLLVIAHISNLRLARCGCRAGRVDRT